MTTPPVALDELMTHLNMSDSSNDVELDMHLKAATELVEGQVGAIVTRDVTEVLESKGGRLFPTSLPIVSLVSVIDSYDVEVTDGYLDAGMIVRPYGSVFARGRWTVEYTAGRGVIADVPSALKLAVLIVTKHLWETQRGGGKFTRGGYGQAAGEPVVVPAGWSGAYAIPNRAKELMVPYCIPVFA